MKPLAYKLRPKSTSEIIGQSHLLGEDKVITKIINSKKLVSMIFYGRPGIGKTTIVEAICNDMELRHRKLNAVINNKKDIDTVIEEAKFYGEIVLVMDEIHRLNKDKQDILLPHIESGLIILIGMTTVNAYHSVNPAIRSRCQIYELKPLTNLQIKAVLHNSIESEFIEKEISDEIITIITRQANGDARYALNLLELAHNTAVDEVSVDHLNNILPDTNIMLDKNADEHYNLLSAFQKSIRGSDVDAALHYTARLIVQEDFESLFRRMTIIAYEDISLANPQLCQRVVLGINACKEIGMPEMRIIIANLIVEMALSPKSNAAYSALDEAISDVRNGLCGKIPANISQNPVNYLYPHDFPNGIVKQNYMPDNLKGKKYYKPSDNSKFEHALKQRIDLINKISK